MRKDRGPRGDRSRGGLPHAASLLLASGFCVSKAIRTVTHTRAARLPRAQNVQTIGRAASRAPSRHVARHIGTFDPRRRESASGIFAPVPVALASRGRFRAGGLASSSIIAQKDHFEESLRPVLLSEDQVYRRPPRLGGL